jgi:tetratricopeptide (TPR) repeat protein
VLPLLEQAIADTPDSLPFRLALAIGHAVTGRTDEPRRLLEEAAATGFATIPENWTWMTTVLGYAVLAIELEHAEAAAQLFPLIEPFGDEVAFNGATSQGPVGAYLGKLASLIGRHDEAEAHLTRALALTRTFGWRYHEATTLLALARAALRRTGSLDDGARAHLDEAGALASEFGIGIVASEVARLRAGAVSL